jgi:hypothetical protein
MGQTRQRKLELTKDLRIKHLFLSNTHLALLLFTR